MMNWEVNPHTYSFIQVKPPSQLGARTGMVVIKREQGNDRTNPYQHNISNLSGPKRIGLPSSPVEPNSAERDIIQRSQLKSQLKSQLIEVQVRRPVPLSYTPTKQADNLVVCSRPST